MPENNTHQAPMTKIIDFIRSSKFKQLPSPQQTATINLLKKCIETFDSVKYSINSIYARIQIHGLENIRTTLNNMDEEANMGDDWLETLELMRPIWPIFSGEEFPIPEDTPVVDDEPILENDEPVDEPIIDENPIEPPLPPEDNPEIPEQPEN